MPGLLQLKAEGQRSRVNMYISNQSIFVIAKIGDQIETKWTVTQRVAKQDRLLMAVCREQGV